MIGIDIEQIWSIADEQDAVERDRDRRGQTYTDGKADYLRKAWARNGEKVRLTVPHPFADETWTIIGPAEPGFYHLACRFQQYEQWRGFEQCFHESEFVSHSV